MTGSPVVRSFGILKIGIGVTFKDISFCAKFFKLLLKILLFYGTLDRSRPIPEYPSHPVHGMVWFVKLRYGRQIRTNSRVSKLLSDPVHVVGHIGVHPQGVWPGTPDTPGSDAYGAVAPRVRVSGHKGASTVPITRVSAPCPSTDHPRRDGPVPHHGPKNISRFVQKYSER